MTMPPDAATRRSALRWWALSLAAVTVLGLALTGGVGLFDRMGVLPAPQAPAWYDCATGAQPYALHYLPGSDRIGLQWPDGQRLQGASFPDRIEWRDAGGLAPARALALPQALRYESAERLELRNAAQAVVHCQRRPTAPTPSAP